MRRLRVTCFTGRELVADPDARIVAVDVIRATTTAITAAALGRRCFPVMRLAAARALSAREPGSLLVGELGGETPSGFHLSNSPSLLAQRDDVERPVVLLSSSGTQLMCTEGFRRTLYVACLRNWAATAKQLASQPWDVVLVGAGTRGEFRIEDQLCCARIGAYLLAAGYHASGATRRLIDRWATHDLAVVRKGHSAAFLLQSGQADDLEFVLEHENDISDAYVFRNGEIKAGDTADSLALAAAA
jgi:2-phosphosulfolactate phosphatase